MPLEPKEISKKYGSQAEKHSIWKVSYKGFHKDVKKALEADPLVRAGFATFEASRSKPDYENFVQLVVRTTGNAGGALLANHLGPDHDVDPSNSDRSLFKLLKSGAAGRIADELAEDPEMEDDVDDGSFELLVHRLSRKAGRGIGDELGFDDFSSHILDVVKKLVKLPVNV